MVTSIGSIDGIQVRAGERELPNRLVSYAVEHDQDARRLHAQVDVPAQGFQQSALRQADTLVELVVNSAAR